MAAVACWGGRRYEFNSEPGAKPKMPEALWVGPSCLLSDITNGVAGPERSRSIGRRSESKLRSLIPPTVPSGRSVHVFELNSNVSEP